MRPNSARIGPNSARIGPNRAKQCQNRAKWSHSGPQWSHSGIGAPGPVPRGGGMVRTCPGTTTTRVPTHRADDVPCYTECSQRCLRGPGWVHQAPLRYSQYLTVSVPSDTTTFRSLINKTRIINKYPEISPLMPRLFPVLGIRESSKITVFHSFGRKVVINIGKLSLSL